MHVCEVNNTYVLVGLKSGPIHAYQDFSYKKTIHGADQMCCSLVVDMFLFIGGMQKVYMLSTTSLELISSVATSEWVFSLCQLNFETIMCGQSYGYIDCVQIWSEPRKLHTMIKSKFEQCSHIYNIVKTLDSTAEKINFVICGYTGVYFGSIQNQFIGISEDVHLQKQAVRNIVEFAPNKFLVGIEGHPAYVILDKQSSEKHITEIRTKVHKSRCSFLHDTGVKSYFIGRNSQSLDLINVETGQARALIMTTNSEK